MKKEKPSLICIIGVDGVGKTTHAKEILVTLQNRSVRSEYRWFRFFHFFSFFLLVYCRLTGLTKYEMKNGQRIGRHDFYKSKIVSFFYPLFLFIDMSFMYFVKISLPLHFGTTLVCDRFIYDTIVDLMIELRDDDIHIKDIGKLFLRLIPKNTKVVLLTLNQSIIRERRKDLINDQLLVERERVYLSLAQYFGIPIVNNDGNIFDVHREIIQVLELNK